MALTLWSMPTFWLGMLLLGGRRRRCSRPPGIVDSDTPPDFLSQALDVAHHLVLPTITLVAVIYAQYLLVMRSSLIEEMGADYLTTARAKGLRDDLVRRRHAVPNALLPTVTLVFLHLGFVIAGAVTRRDGVLLARPRPAHLRRAAGPGPAAAAGHVHRAGGRGDRS